MNSPRSYVNCLFLVSSLCLPVWANTESLYQESTFRALTEDRRAFRVGDAVTVMVFENSSASSSADTAARRRNSASADVLAPTSGNRSFGLQTGGGFDGRGQSQRTGKLLAQITVSVSAIAANGELHLSGQQLLVINDEKQQIKLEGRIRVADISDSNTVLSTRLADAKISYVGDGELASNQRPSWWMRLLRAVGI